MSSSFLLIPPCQICGEQVTTKHPWEIHKIKIKDYYEKYHPKYDLFSHEQLSFKNQENYFLTDFICCFLKIFLNLSQNPFFLGTYFITLFLAII